MGAFFIYKITSAFIRKWMPRTVWAKLLYTLIGLGLGLAYIYFAGYYVMAKEANTLTSLFIAFIPWVVYITWVVMKKAKIIDE
jgi:hypothetical protein